MRAKSGRQPFNKKDECEKVKVLDKVLGQIFLLDRVGGNFFGRDRESKRTERPPGVHSKLNGGTESPGGV